MPQVLVDATFRVHAEESAEFPGTAHAAERVEAALRMKIGGIRSSVWAGVHALNLRVTADNVLTYLSCDCYRNGHRWPDNENNRIVLLDSIPADLPVTETTEGPDFARLVAGVRSPIDTVYRCEAIIPHYTRADVLDMFAAHVDPWQRRVKPDTVNGVRTLMALGTPLDEALAAIALVADPDGTGWMLTA